jgi:hypothetical protein
MLLGRNSFGGVEGLQRGASSDGLGLRVAAWKASSSLAMVVLRWARGDFRAQLGVVRGRCSSALIPGAEHYDRGGGDGGCIIVAEAIVAT